MIWEEARREVTISSEDAGVLSLRRGVTEQWGAE